MVSFDVPYPPNYGGVIDVYYKIKALHDNGIKVHLHTYEYGRGKQNKLNEICASVTYYKRSKSPLNLLSRKPFIVKSRSDTKLIKNLKKDTFPILFEGLHTTYPLIDFDFNERIVLIRTHNIEHKYYDGLAKSEESIGRRSFFKQEAKKLLHYQNILQKANYILTISPFEHQYFQNKFGKKAVYIPVFHKNNAILKLSDRGDFALYHGDLRVSDNLKASLFLVDIFKDLDIELIIASSYTSPIIDEKIKMINTISFHVLKDNSELDQLFKNAHVNVLPTFQKTGIKLKLIHALFQSRFCVVNSAMIEDTGLENLCEVANTVKEFKEKIIDCFNKDFDVTEIKKREKLLQTFDNLSNAKKIISLIS